MIRIMSDNDVLGYVKRVVDICQTSAWLDLWRELGCTVCTFRDLGLSSDASDTFVWQACQANEVILITGNRSANDLESLEVTIRQQNRADSLPVLTLSDPRRIVHDREYADLVVERLFEVLLDIELLRGTGRLFLP
jgi:hypothetical protein